MKRKEQESSIAEFLTVQFTAICDKCQHEESLMACDDDEAACGFYDNGWRVRSGLLICARTKHPLHRKR